MKNFFVLFYALMCLVTLQAQKGNTTGCSQRYLSRTKVYRD